MSTSGGNRSRRGLSLGANPVPEESLPGFLMRFGAWAGIARPDRLAGMVGLRQPGSAATDDDLSDLASFASTGVGLLERIAYGPTGRFAHHRFLGGEVHREFIVLDRRRACPACLAERPLHRAAWDFALASACPTHAIRLVHRCPGCRRGFGWDRSDPARCRCGLTLADIGGEAVPAEETAANARALELVAGMETSWLARPLAGLDRADMPHLLMCLGMFLTGWPRQRRIETLVAAGTDAVAAVLIAGVRALEDWPLSIHAFLRQQAAAAAGRKGRYGARKTIGPFYEWLTQMEAGAVKDVLSAATASFVSGDPRLSRRSHRSSLVASPGAGRLVGLNEAARMLGTSGVGVRRLMRAGVLPEAMSDGRGVPMLIERASVEAAACKAHLDLAGAAAALGISKARIRRLVKGGLLVPVHRAAAEGNARWAFSAREMESLLEEVSRAASQVPGASSTVGFETAAEALRRRGVDLPAMLGLVRSGRMPAAATDDRKAGFKRLRFDARSVRALCRELEGESLTVQTAAERMGLKWQVVANLVAKGLLRPESGRIAAAEADRFTAEHVTGGQLARERGTSPRALAAGLAKEGVLPVAGPGVDGSRLNIYSIKSVRTSSQAAKAGLIE